MRRVMSLAVVLCLLAAPGFAVTADELVKFFEESQNLTNSAMISFKVLKKASDAKVADMFDFVADKSYDYEGMILNGAKVGGKGGPLAQLLAPVGDGVLAVLHKLATDDDKKMFKPTWIGYHTPADKRVSNWFCLIMGDHVKTYLTRVDMRSKLDEIGADPLQMNILNKNLFTFEVVKDLGAAAVLKMTPKPEAKSSVREALIEMRKLELGGQTAWYVTKIEGHMLNGATGTTEFGNFRVAFAPAGAYIAWSDDGKLTSAVPCVGIGTALREPLKPDQKMYIFATQLQTTTQQKSKELNDYEVVLQTNVKHLHINPTPEVMAQYIRPDRLKTLIKVARKVVDSH